jgi:hypothetical protein
VSSETQKALVDKVEKFAQSQEEIYAEDRKWELPCPHYLLFQGPRLFKMMALAMPRQEALRLRDGISMASSVFGVDSFLHVSEAYMRTTSEEEDPELFRRVMKEGLPEGTLAQDPKSVEVLNVFGGDFEGNRVHIAWAIHREAKEDTEILIKVCEYYSWSSDKNMEVTSSWDLWKR